MRREENHHWLEDFLEGVPAHPAVSNSFLRKVGTTRLSHDELLRFGSQYFRWVEAFPKILAGLAYCVPDDCRFEVVRTLYSELGEGDPSQMHSRLLLGVFEGLGVNREQLISVPEEPATNQLIEVLDRLYSRSSIPVALGAQLGVEAMATPMIEQLYSGFGKLYGLSADALTYFTLHLEVERDHIEWSKSAVLKWNRGPDDTERIRQGLFECLDGIAGFWSNLA